MMAAVSHCYLSVPLAALCCACLLGVLVVPSLLIISQFTAIAAVALSNVTILATAIANLVRREKKGPRVEWGWGVSSGGRGGG